MQAEQGMLCSAKDWCLQATKYRPQEFYTPLAEALVIYSDCCAYRVEVESKWRFVCVQFGLFVRTLYQPSLIHLVVLCLTAGSLWRGIVVKGEVSSEAVMPAEGCAYFLDESIDADGV